MKLAVLFCLGLSLSVCVGAAQADQTAEDAALAGRTTESQVLAASGGRAARLGDELILTLAGGQKQVFHGDACGAGASACRSFRLAADLASRHLFLIAVRQDGHAAGYILIDDRNGARTQLDGVPVFSPDNARFLLTLDGDGDNPHAFEIWRRGDKGWALEWSYGWKRVFASDPSLHRPFRSHVVAWNGDRITLAFALPGTSRRWGGSLTLGPNGWRLSAAD
jgi:hypothetical protein